MVLHFCERNSYPVDIIVNGFFFVSTLELWSAVGDVDSWKANVDIIEKLFV